MAVGFKKATVKAADVPATQTNFPAYIDLSRLGITTLAEAQSVRVYADSGKVTEWAREIVNAEQMHVKIPSLTSTVEVFVDWDGVRADYAVTATYGRNNVWSAYESVFHMEDTSGTLVDSTGKTGLAVTGTPTYATAAKIDNGIDYPGSTDYNSKTGAASPAPPLTISAWFKANDVTSPDAVAFMGESGIENGLLTNNSQLWALSQNSGNAQAVSGAISNGVWYLGHGVFTDASNRAVYLNGAAGGTNTTTKSTTTGTGMAIAWRFSSAGQEFNGTLDEVRFIKAVLSANWITTEYNNQSDEADFWGTWSNVSGSTIKTVDGVTRANVKTFLGVASANIKTINGIT